MRDLEEEARSKIEGRLWVKSNLQKLCQWVRMHHNISWECIAHHCSHFMNKNKILIKSGFPIWVARVKSLLSLWIHFIACMIEFSTLWMFWLLFWLSFGIGMNWWLSPYGWLCCWVTCNSSNSLLLIVGMIIKIMATIPIRMVSHSPLIWWFCCWSNLQHRPLTETQGIHR